MYWCHQLVQIEGQAKDVLALRRKLQAIIHEQKNGSLKGLGVSLDNYMKPLYHISLYDDEASNTKIKFKCKTKTSSALFAVYVYCNANGLDFTIGYVSDDYDIGEFKFTNKRLKSRILTNEDRDLVYYDDDEESYGYNEEWSDSPYDFYQEIIDNKPWLLTSEDELLAYE